MSNKARAGVIALAVVIVTVAFVALRPSDSSKKADDPAKTVKTEAGRGTYRKPRPKSDASVRTVALPPFAVALLNRRRNDGHAANDLDAVFATRNGTWHQVVNIERRWRQIRKDTGYEWVTPHTFRKTVATLISEATTSELASRQLGHSSSQVTRDHYIAKPAVSADLSMLLETLAQKDEPGPEV